MSRTGSMRSISHLRDSLTRHGSSVVPREVPTLMDVRRWLFRKTRALKRPQHLNRIAVVNARGPTFIGFDNRPATVLDEAHVEDKGRWSFDARKTQHFACKA